MRKEEKRYRLNNDFEILCITIIQESKTYGIYVNLISVPFLCTVEKVENIKSADEANNYFKFLVNKYKEGIKLCH